MGLDLETNLYGRSVLLILLFSIICRNNFVVYDKSEVVIYNK